MEVKSWTKQWWEILVVLFGVISFVMGFMALGDPDISQWGGTQVGFGPGVLLLGALAVRRNQRVVATVMILVGCVAAAIAWWMVYPVVFSVPIVVGGFLSGKIGFQGSGPEIAA